MNSHFVRKVTARQAGLRMLGLTGRSAQVEAEWTDSTGVRFPIAHADNRVKAYRVEKK
jgi:hypothetical protein